VLATSGPKGSIARRAAIRLASCVRDEKTLLIPDRRGNNRIDSMRNLVRDPRMALLFLIPGVGETIRVIGVL
jgi:predicted pyridoxine 5'-phosphate oxidase superfamily flavin-nucleotide-binding protein